MSSSEYWRKRESEALKARLKDEDAYQKDIETILKNMRDAVQKEIDSFYAKYANSEGITLAEAKKRISKADIEAYARKAEKYVKERDFSKRANEEMRLYNATMKINRLELLKANIGLELLSGTDEIEKLLNDALHQRTMDEYTRQAGILGKTIVNNAKKAKNIVDASFHNATFSERIWNDQALLRAEIDKLLQTGLIQGKNPRVLARELKKVFNTTTANAERLMRTELARVQIAAQKDSFVANGFKQYTFIVNTGCCPVCAALNDKHFDVAKMMPGTNAPPMHPNCRCSVAAYEDDDEYEAWLDFLDKGGTTEEWEKIKNRDIIQLNDTIIRKSVGAKSRNYDIIDPETGEVFHFSEGTRIQNSIVFAGKGTKHNLHEGVPEGLTKEFGGSIEKWQHCKGNCVVDFYGEERKAEVHWFQEETVGKVKFKIKRWIDED